MRDEYDFRGAKRAKDVPHLAKLLAESAEVQVGRGQPPLVVDPRTKAECGLIPASEHNADHEIVEDERQQSGIRAVALRNVARHLAEDR